MTDVGSQQDALRVDSVCRGSSRPASIVFFGVLPALTIIVLFVAAIQDDSVAMDFRQFYAAAESILRGENPYPEGSGVLAAWGGPYPYPPLPRCWPRRLLRCPPRPPGSSSWDASSSSRSRFRTSSMSATGAATGSCCCGHRLSRRSRRPISPSGSRWLQPSPGASASACSPLRSRSVSRSPRSSSSGRVVVWLAATRRLLSAALALLVGAATAPRVVGRHRLCGLPRLPVTPSAARAHRRRGLLHRVYRRARPRPAVARSSRRLARARRNARCSALSSSHVAVTSEARSSSRSPPPSRSLPSYGSTTSRCSSCRSRSRARDSGSSGSSRLRWSSRPGADIQPRSRQPGLSVSQRSPLVWRFASRMGALRASPAPATACTYRWQRRERLRRPLTRGRASSTSCASTCGRSLSWSGMVAWSCALFALVHDGYSTSGSGGSTSGTWSRRSGARRTGVCSRSTDGATGEQVSRLGVACRPVPRPALAALDALALAARARVRADRRRIARCASCLLAWPAAPRVGALPRRSWRSATSPTRGS